MSPFRSNNYVDPKILLFLLNRRKQQRNLNEILLFPNHSNLAQKVNPISVRLHMNRSSDSSWFSDHYYGKFVYQDVNLFDYVDLIRLPKRRNPKRRNPKRRNPKRRNLFGFRLGRGILHRSPKRTFIHLYLHRRPPLNSNSRGRGGSSPGKRRGTIEKGKSIGILSLKGGSERRGLGAGETVVRSMRLDDRSRVIWRAKQRYGYHDRSPPHYYKGDIPNPAVRPYLNDLVMQYLFRLENPLSYRKPNRSASSECCDHYSSDRCSLFPFFLGATLLFLREKLRVRVSERRLFRRENFRVRVGERRLFLRNYLKMRVGERRAPRFAGARLPLVWILKKIFRTYILRRLKKIFRKPFHTYMHRGSGSVKELILGRIGGVMRGIEMMLGAILRRAKIPYGYNNYMNKVQKVRSLLSGRTNTNIFIGSVKIKSVYQSASLIAQDISLRLRGRKSFRSIFYEPVRDIPLVMLKRVGGIRICCSGRLKGAEIARTECMEYRKTSRNAFRHRIDYASAKVSTRYGILGVKVWIPFL